MDEVINLCAKVQYISSATPRDLSSLAQLLTADVNERTRSTFQKLKDLFSYAHITTNGGLRFVHLDF